MLEFIVSVIDGIGLLGTAALIALESVVVPISSEIVLLLTGFNVAKGNFGFSAAVIATTIGSLTGAFFLYALGRLFSYQRLEKLFERLYKILRVRNSDLDTAFNKFTKYGTFIILFGRLIPVIRSLVSIPAGLAKMPIWKFATLTTIGSASWNLIWISIGKSLGDKWESAESWAKLFDYVVYFGILILLIWFLQSRKNRQT
jgi:membrane protein DedA with SNARE-associated domain